MIAESAVNNNGGLSLSTTGAVAVAPSRSPSIVPVPPASGGSGASAATTLVDPGPSSFTFTFTAADEAAMTKALEQAQLALHQGEIPVGCVFVDQLDRVVAVGHNKTNETRNGTRHAEMVAMDELILVRKQDPSILRQCRLYVTCEPCIMCAAALGKMGIQSVYFGCFNERFGGNGSILSIHSDSHCKDMHNYPIHAGLLADQAIAVFQTFYTTENRRAPESKRKRKPNSTT